MRYVLLDRITHVEVGAVARGLKCVTLTDEVLHDHFPDFPVLPGVLMVESAAQLAGYLLEATAHVPGTEPRRAVLGQIDRTKFSRPAEPGDVIELEAKIGQMIDAGARMEVEATIRGERAMRGTLTFLLRAVHSERLHAERRYLYRLWTRGLAGEVPIP